MQVCCSNLNLIAFFPFSLLSSSWPRSILNSIITASRSPEHSAQQGAAIFLLASLIYVKSSVVYSKTFETPRDNNDTPPPPLPPIHYSASWIGVYVFPTQQDKKFFFCGKHNLFCLVCILCQPTIMQ